MRRRRNMRRAARPAIHGVVDYKPKTNIRLITACAYPVMSRARLFLTMIRG